MKGLLIKDFLLLKRSAKLILLFLARILRDGDMERERNIFRKPSSGLVRHHGQLDV